MSKPSDDAVRKEFEAWANKQRWAEDEPPRLTAEQFEAMLLDDKGYTPSPEAVAAARFWMNSELRGDVTYPRPLARIIDSVAESFRDQSEAELRAKLAEQEDANRKLLHEVMQLSAERVSLKNDAAALRERERWISVEEKLPPQNRKVLVWRSTVPKMDILYYGESAFWGDGEEDTNVTHWKALSAAPEHGKDEK